MFKLILDLDVGMEIYIENQLIEELTTAEVTEVDRKLRDLGIECTVHAPFMDLSPGGYDRSVRTITAEKLKRTVEMAHLLHARGVVCHPGYDKWRFGGNEDLWLEGSIETWTQVIKEAKGGPPLMVENIFEEQPSTFIALFDYFKDDLWFCFDTGHFNLFTSVGVDGWLLPLKDRVREMHLHDNHHTRDEHLPIGAGTFPFRELKAILKGMAGGILYTSEVHSESRALESIKKIKEFLS